MDITDVNKILSLQIEQHSTPSVQYVFFDKDEIVYKFQKGLADIKQRIKTDENTTFNAFSTTKTFTALAILQLAEQRKLKIDDSAKKYLPDFPYSSEITIRHLLNHTSGIPNPIPLSWVHLESEHDSFNSADFFKPIFEKYHKAKSKPNEKFVYSNLGYVLLGQLIEKVSGLNYQEYIRENILRPLNIKEHEISFKIENLNHYAKGYQYRFNFTNVILGFLIDKTKFTEKADGKWIPWKRYYVNGTPHGGLMGTPMGLVKYIQGLLNPAATIISSEYKKMLFTENVTNSGKKTGMCLSWFKGILNNEEYFAHAGGGGGYYCEIRIYPKIAKGSVIMFNRSGMTDERFLDKLDQCFISET